MHVSVTGLKTKGPLSAIRFWMLAIPAFTGAQKSKGNVFCETKIRNGFHHTLTVWETKADMMAYRKSPSHLKAMQVFSSIATGLVYGYESETVPSWSEALSQWEEHGREV